MPTAKDIIERANAAFVVAGNRCRSREEEILRQRNAALSNFPAVQAALAAETTAVTKGNDDFALESTRIQADLATAEQNADTAQRDADDAALAKWRQTDDDASTTLHRSLAQAQDTFQETLRVINETQHTINAQDQARLIKERGIAAAQSTFERSKQTDFDAFRRESTAALEAHLKAIERARRDADVALAKARTARDVALSKAHLALRTALLANPLAASIAEAFANQLSQSAVDCEQAKAAILKQMRDDLAAIGHGHPSVTV